jgi:phosphatidate cytidylyltransferase
MLKYRLIFGPIMIAALLALFYGDNQLDRLDIGGTWLQDVMAGRDHLPRGLLVLAAFLVLICAAASELCAIFKAKAIEADRLMVTLAGVTGCLLMFAIPQHLSARTTMAIFATLMITLFLLALLKHSWVTHRTQGAVAAAAVVMFALIYMGLLPGFLLSIRRWHSAWVLMAVLLITKSADIGAFATGKSIGKHKMIPWLSPAKTWEGLVGGIALASLVAVALATLSNRFDIAGLYQMTDGGVIFESSHFHLGRTAAFGAIMGLIGQFGDLIASLFKRDAGIKDSGRSIPGFGGLLDVVDSPIVVAPFAYWLLVLGAGMA